MLQGFYWDSHSGTNNTKWTTLTGQADELSKYFKIIWVPNGAKCASSPSMGYDPVYWFSNYNTAWGTESQLRNMIKTFKEKGTGIMADVVINHRSGKSNWTDFPAETWKGVTYQLGPQHICRTDEVKDAPGQAKPTGAPDTGEDFGGSRDLDHTSAEVQRNCKAYTQFLIEDMGYCGFRYDMAKGYSGSYTKIYNEASHPTFSVGEYWDGYDGIAYWIESTGRQSAAFDFPCKYAINDAFHSNDMTKLVWKANGTTDQPAGMIHFGYPQYAVTFIDNHDTYRDGSKFNGNVVAANAFILCSPGTPCVFWPHYTANKAAIQKLIDIRNACGVHNQSAVKVLRSSRDCYMAEVYGKKGTLVVKIGSSMDSPAGYSNSDIKATGNGYCVWTKTTVGGGSTPTPTPSPESFKVYFNNATSNWTTPHIHYWGGEESTWPGVAMSKVTGTTGIWSYTVPAGTTGILFNAGDGDASKTQDFVAEANHVYTTAGDQGVYSQGDVPIGGNYPAEIYLIGNLQSGSWNTATSEPANSKNNGVYKWENVTLTDAGDGNAYFSFVTTRGADWDEVNGSDRYGSATKDEPITAGNSSDVVLFPVNVNASSANSWSIMPGKYDFTLDLSSMKLKVSTMLSTVAYELEEDEAPIYYNLQGVKIDSPGNGIYIVVRGNKISKEYIR